MIDLTGVSAADRESNVFRDDLFFLPPLPFLIQTFSIGELFHPRTKFPPMTVETGDGEQSNADLRRYFVSGLFRCSYASVPKFLISPSLTNRLQRMTALLKARAIVVEP
jgi:hypothetical protein